jgi:hypothetical protein
MELANSRLEAADKAKNRKAKAAAVSKDIAAIRRLHFKDFGGLANWQVCQGLEQSVWAGMCKVAGVSKEFRFTLHGLSPLPVAKTGDTMDYQAQGSYSIDGEQKKRCAVVLLNKVEKTWNLISNEPPNFDVSGSCCMVIP